MMLWSLGRGIVGIFGLVIALIPFLMAVYGLLLLKSVKDNSEATRQTLEEIKEILRQQD